MILENSPALYVKMVGTAGFEPTTPGPPDQCAARLRYVPEITN